MPTIEGEGAVRNVMLTTMAVVFWENTIGKGKAVCDQDGECTSAQVCQVGEGEQ
jgi:hypothetical protein